MESNSFLGQGTIEDSAFSAPRLQDSRYHVPWVFSYSPDLLLALTFLERDWPTKRFLTGESLNDLRWMMNWKLQKWTNRASNDRRNYEDGSAVATASRMTSSTSSRQGGKVKWKAVPSLTMDSTQIRPSCNSTIFLHRASPIPVQKNCGIAWWSYLGRIHRQWRGGFPFHFAALFWAGWRE